MRDVEGMSVVITGGGSGIGAGTARHFVRRGARVTICGRREDRVRELAAELGPACAWCRADVADREDRARLLEVAVAHGGGIDVLVNAAGNMYRGALEDLDEQRLLDLFHANVVGAMMLTSAALPHLVDRRGAVVFFGSVHVVRAFPGASPYAATKGALETITGVLAAELGPRQVRVGCIRPGGVFTEINQRAGLFDDETALRRLEDLGPAHALGRIGTVEEIAEGVEYLARAEWTTGTVLVIDGGLGLGVTNA
jgi:NAD(P)-dependent dehydrogenase (short-subunit alcohol dehydrogenase family)